MKTIGRSLRYARRHGLVNQMPSSLPKPARPYRRLDEWLKEQPGSTRRGVARGNFQLPGYVIPV